MANTPRWASAAPAGSPPGRNETLCGPLRAFRARLLNGWVLGGPRGPYGPSRRLPGGLDRVSPPRETGRRGQSWVGWRGVRLYFFAMVFQSADASRLAFVASPLARLPAPASLV